MSQHAAEIRERSTSGAGRPRGQARRRVASGDVGADDVLVLRGHGLGDMLTAVPALRALRRRIGRRRLVLATTPELGGWLAAQGVVDAVLPTLPGESLPSMPGGHLVVDLHGDGSQSREALMATGARLVVGFGGAAGDGPSLAWNGDEHDVVRWCRLVAAMGAAPNVEDLRLQPRLTADDELPQRGGPRGRVVIHPGSVLCRHRWPVDRWAVVGRHLVADGHVVLVTGTDEEHALCDGVEREMRGLAVNLCGRLGIAGLTSVVSDASLVLSGDTSIAHLATAVATPSVTLFGPTSPTQWGPLIDHDLHTVLWGAGPDDPDNLPDDGIPPDDGADPRLEAISPAVVLTAARRHVALGRRPPGRRTRLWRQAAAWQDPAPASAVPASVHLRPLVT